MFEILVTYFCHMVFLHVVPDIFIDTVVYVIICMNSFLAWFLDLWFFRADSFEALEENNSLRASDRDYETWQAVEISQEVYITSS